MLIEGAECHLTDCAAEQRDAIAAVAKAQEGVEVAAAMVVRASSVEIVQCKNEEAKKKVLTCMV